MTSGSRATPNRLVSNGQVENSRRLIVRRLGLLEYQAAWERMKRFTEARHEQTDDELWLVEHPPVFTLGQAGRMKHLHGPGDIPVITSDRGGQVTYHGPGQLVAYVLLDLKRRQLGVRSLVHSLEQCVIDLLLEEGIQAQRRSGAPGVYVRGEKIAALGLRVRSGRCYHGLSLNVCMDLSPFSTIDPCGYEDLSVTQLRALGLDWDLQAAARAWLRQFERQLDYCSGVDEDIPRLGLRSVAVPGRDGSDSPLT